MERIETGVMIMKDGKAWGVAFQDGHSTSYSFIDPTRADIHDPKYCKKPTDATYRNSPYIKQLETAELVTVERKTTVRIV